jgi:hypothetical protein
LALERRRVSPPEASQRAMTDPMPPVPMTATHGLWAIKDSHVLRSTEFAVT